ncbi:uncharacterized protein LOC125959487 [Anopheles darlingi]|uniref:uncharacterized protein LOC125959487 n=1 Tax=Anopheles darlingi TaxID=43151 RepID=UPI002100228A|nr:uncharacterized protein LOC125959487 [Anopheles darlingi]
MASIVVQFCRRQPIRLHEFLLQNHEQLMFVSLLIGLASGGVHWSAVRYPALIAKLHENLRAFPVEISFGVFALLSIGSLLSYKLYLCHRASKDAGARRTIRQRYIDYIVLCLAVSVSNASHRHLGGATSSKDGLPLEQLERYRKEIESAIFRFRASTRKVFHEPPAATYSLQYLEWYFRLDDERYGDEILSLKRDTNSLMNVPAIKGLLDF